MDPLLPRRRSSEPDQPAKKPLLSPSAMHSSSWRSCISSLPLFLLLLTVCWFYAFFHACIFSQKLGLPCLSGELNGGDTTPSHTPIPVNKKPDNGISSAHEQAQAIRSWSSETTKNNSLRLCGGRGVFVYGLPPKFNKDLLSWCSDILPWASLCDDFYNEGMGQPVPELGEGWYATYMFSLEIIFHSRILNHPCRVQNPDDARVFYVPVYGGFDILSWNFRNVSTDVKDALGRELIQWLESQSSWLRNEGRDHMFVLATLTRDFRRGRQTSWGSNFLVVDQMLGPYKLLVERQPWDINEIGAPYPTNFHPHNDSDIVDCQVRIANSSRTRFVTFAGGSRAGTTGELRAALAENCVANAGVCKLLDCSSGSCTPEAVTTTFMESEFCLQPPGDSPTRKSMFDSLVSACIPVFFNKYTAYYQYPWHLPEDHRRYSVFIDQKKVKEGKLDVVERLKRISLKRREEMRRFIVHELMPGLVYGDPSSEFVRFRDAFGIVMDNVIDLITETAK